MRGDHTPAWVLVFMVKIIHMLALKNTTREKITEKITEKISEKILRRLLRKY